MTKRKEKKCFVSCHSWHCSALSLSLLNILFRKHIKSNCSCIKRIEIFSEHSLLLSNTINLCAQSPSTGNVYSEKCPKTEARDLTSSQTDVSLKYTNLLQSSEDILFEEILLRLEAKKILWKEWNILSNECTSNEESFPIHTAQRKIVFNVLYNNSTKGRLCNDTNFSNYTWLFGSLLVVVDVDAVGNVPLRCLWCCLWKYVNF